MIVLLFFAVAVVIGVSLFHRRRLARARKDFLSELDARDRLYGLPRDRVENKALAHNGRGRD